MAAWLVVSGAAARELRVADTHPADYPTVQALQHMARLVGERSRGTLTIKVLHSQVMGDEYETIQHVRAGALDMARVNLTPLNSLVPETIVPSLPYVFRSAEHLHRVMDGPIGAEISKAIERHGFVALAYYDAGARSFYNSRHPITTPADLKGLRIRVQQSPVAEAMVRALGADAQPLPYGQVGIGLDAGVIDGAENNWTAYHASGHCRSARYYSPTEHTMAPEVLLISRKVWDELSAAEQVLLRQGAHHSVTTLRTLWPAHERAARDAMAGMGVQTSTVDHAAFAKVLRPVQDRLANTAVLKDLLRRTRATE
ncbi:MAG TPA: TRAP transporter substrate-binding protein [Magnetospirillum sp.]|nr:TRAP transporter substrate-binding protein [Magnetospirillum sp.]